MRFLVPLILCAGTALADPAEVTQVRMTQSGDSWRFDVTLLHADTGWDHYADGWRIEDADGNVLGERPLAHPHVNEQPFTRSTSGVVIPDGITEVYVRTRDNVDGWHPDVFAVKVE
ncbi:hypothetical protein AB3Y40_14300 [Yoonia sp. R2331]|uniref:hypothetical protein n=1 Tax=Yoonia sp. R2331 TaxID=3237238 RepID=UPI0034E52BCA